jgi:hypothetical protein
MQYGTIYYQRKWQKKWQKRCTVGRYGTYHRVDRVLGFFSSRPSVSTPPLTRRRVCPPPPLLLFFLGGGVHTPLRERGMVSLFGRGDRR